MVGISGLTHKTNAQLTVVYLFDYLEGKLDLSSETDKYKDFKFVKWLSKNVKLQGIPFSVFYNEANKHTAENYLRFCFFKVISFPV